MNRKLKSFISGLLSLVLVLNMVVFTVIAEPAQTLVSLSESFDANIGSSFVDIFAAEKGWLTRYNGTGVTVNSDGALTAANQFGAFTGEKFLNGYVEADVTFSGAVNYVGNMHARCSKTVNSPDEIAIRWLVKDNGTATVQLVIRGTDYNLSGGNIIVEEATVNYTIGTAMKVKLQTVGNLIQVFVDGSKIMAVALDAAYDVAAEAGAFGISLASNDVPTVTYDNLVIQEYNTYTVTTAAGVTPQQYKDAVNDTMRDRTAYIAGETIVLEISDDHLDAATLTVVDTTGTPVVLTTVKEGIQYSFIMPADAVTVSCQNGSGGQEPEETINGEVLADMSFEDIPDGALGNVLDEKWSTTALNASNHTIKNGAVNTLYGFTAQHNTAFNTGYIQADICLLEAVPALISASGSKTVYGGNLSLRHCAALNGLPTEELRTRFQVTKDVSGNYTANLQLVVYSSEDPGYGTKAAQCTYPLEDFTFGNTYQVRLAAVGNYVAVSLNGNVVMQYCLETASALSVFEGYGAIGHVSNSFRVTFDNIYIVKQTSYSVCVDSGLEEHLSFPAYAEPMSEFDTKAETVYCQRNAFLPTDTVELTVQNPDGLLLQTLCYQAAGEETALVPNEQGVCSFKMPEAAVTVLCDRLSNQASMPYSNTFDSYRSGLTAADLFVNADGWNTVGGANGAVNADGQLSVPAGMTVLTSESLHSGYIQADIQLAEPADVGTYYGGNLYANFVKVGIQEIRTRFAVTKTEAGTTVALQLVTYDKDISGGSDGIYYAKSPMVWSYELGAFDSTAVYTVKLAVVGNLVRVSVNNTEVITKAVNPTYHIAQRAGSFGFGGHTAANKGITATVDNLIIDKYEVYALSVDPAMEEYILLDTYQDINETSDTRLSRNGYLAGEFVMLNLNAVEGKIADTSSLKYTGASGETAITAHNSETLYGFHMPAEDITVTAVAVTAGAGTADKILFSDCFDAERLMIDSGWERDELILNGMLNLDSIGENSAVTLFLTNKLGASVWTDYSVEATLTVTEADNTELTAAAVICARNGYEFGVQFAKGMTQGSFRLYDRTSGQTLYQSEAGEASLGKAYNLKLEVRGTTLAGYVNGQKLFTLTSDSCTAGTIGLRITRAAVECDNVIVTKLD